MSKKTVKNNKSSVMSLEDVYKDLKRKKKLKFLKR